MSIQSLKRAGINFFFVSKELKLYTPLALSPVLSPDHIDQYLGVKWTDGTSYLLTWLDEGVQPLHQDFLTAYRDLVKESPTISSFPISDWRSVFTYFGKNGLHPYHLPWCTLHAKECLPINNRLVILGDRPAIIVGTNYPIMTYGLAIGIRAHTSS
jgi:hypothetical protein